MKRHTVTVGEVAAIQVATLLVASHGRGSNKTLTCRYDIATGVASFVVSVHRVETVYVSLADAVEAYNDAD